MPDPQSQVTHLNRLTPCHFIQYVTVLSVPWYLDVFGDLEWKSTKNHEENVASRISFFFLRIRTGLATTQRPLSVEITSTEVAEKQEDLGKFLRSCLGASPSPNEMYPQVHLPPPKTNMTGWKITFFFNRRYIYIFKWLFFHCHVRLSGG